MHLKRLELNGFKSFAKKSEFVFDVPIIAIVGPNGSGKSNVVEAIRFVLGEQSVKSMRGKTGSDLIFKGSKDIAKMSRARAEIVFDNTDRVFHVHNNDNAKLSVDFDEVVIAREVSQDGSNTYTINGTDVRMKDVHELIASVNIGASGHHIISQGEADRYLNANLRDRRELIEEALGLKMYHYRLKESGRKLSRAQDNMRESELLRREIAPHLKFLKRQVDKIEKAKHLREELHAQYQAYLAQEEFLIGRISNDVNERGAAIKKQLAEINQAINQHQSASQEFEETTLVANVQSQLNQHRTKREEVGRALGRLEGMIDLLSQPQEPKETPKRKAMLRMDDVETAVNDIASEIGGIDVANINAVKDLLKSIKQKLSNLIAQPATSALDVVDNSEKIAEMQVEYDDLSAQISELDIGIQSGESRIIELQATLTQKQSDLREQEKEYYGQLALQKELEGRRDMLAREESELEMRKQSFAEELTEAKTLLGLQEISYQGTLIEHEADVTIMTQETLRRELERKKIRLEDMGGGSGGDVIKEFEETRERDEFLAKEIDDVTSTIGSLEQIIADLKSELDVQFAEGMEKINTEFDKFFKLMFGGGNAKLVREVIKKRKKKATEGQEALPDMEGEEESKEYGIDIQVQLPRKKVSDLDMLSGGERSLTSIALLFSLSQVNPPPFLVLDETDAALDEKNSQKYGDMIESLSKYSQLVVVTHNRETMSRAHSLFGVTLGRDDSSTLLSLRLEDATVYAK